MHAEKGGKGRVGVCQFQTGQPIRGCTESGTAIRTDQPAGDFQLTELKYPIGLELPAFPKVRGARRYPCSCPGAYPFATGTFVFSEKVIDPIEVGQRLRSSESS